MNNPLETAGQGSPGAGPTHAPPSQTEAAEAPPAEGAIRWTDAQQRAIDMWGNDILVSAGAGAGKTAVLVERVIKAITREQNPLEVDRLLVVTFTDAAAEQMRDRIGRALEKVIDERPDSEDLRRQLGLLPKASISTLHSFCLEVVRQYFHQVDLDPAFRIIDENESLILQHEALDALLEERFDSPDDYPGFADLAERYGGEDGRGLEQLVLTLHGQFVTHPFPEEWLKGLLAPFSTTQTYRDAAAGTDAGGDPETGSHAGPDPENHVAPLLEAVVDAAALGLEKAAWLLHRAAGLAAAPGGPGKYLDTLQDEAQQITSLKNAIEGGEAGFDDIARGLEAIEFKRLPSVRKGEADDDMKKAASDLRKAAQKTIEDIGKVFLTRTLAGHLSGLASLFRPVRALVHLVADYDRIFRQVKTAAGGIDFADIERYCLDLLIDHDNAGEEPSALKPSPLARELREKYDAVIVDEYQDINPTQETILSLVSRDGGPEGAPNRFMVGDVKQSIYRFRLAEPNIFLEKYEDYPREPADGKCLIDLQENFRSRANILHGVNFIFRQMFAASAGELGYPSEAHLVYGANYDEVDGHESEDHGDPAIELHVVEKDGARLLEVLDKLETDGAEVDQARQAYRLTADEREAVLTARRINDLMADAAVWDSSAKTYRPLTFGDIAILMRAPRTRAPVYTEVFRRFNIPVNAQLTTGYFDAMEVMIVLALLRVIDNPQQDIQLAAVLASPLVNLEPAELLSIRLAAQRRSFYGAAVVRSRKDDETGGRLRKFLHRLDEWRTMARRGRLAHVLWTIYQETGYLDYVMGLPDGDQRRTNLLALHQRAREFDGFGRRGLFRFLRFIDSLRDKEGDQGQPAPTDAADAVQLMSIHKSKGLEFPVVFLCQAGSQFNRRDTSDRLLTHRDLGLGPEIIDPDLGIRYPSLAHHALRHRLTAEMMAEEMRVLYVAMTRAKERLIIIGSANKLEDKCAALADFALEEEEPLPSSFLHSAVSPLDWTMAALARHDTAGKTMRQHADGAAGKVEPANRELARDISRWDVNLWDGPQALTLYVPEFDGGGAVLPWSKMAAAQPLPPEDTAGALTTPSVEHTDSASQLPSAEDLASLLEERLGWESPWMPLARFAARAAVTEVKRGHDLARTAAGGDEEPAAPMAPGGAMFDDGAPGEGSPQDGDGPSPAPDRGSELVEETDTEERAGMTGKAADPHGRKTGPPRIPLTTPRFLLAGNSVSPVDRGSATHTLLERVQLVPDMTMEHLEKELERLTAAGLIAPAHAEVIDLMSVFWFFHSPLGRRMTRAPWVKRELAFGMKVPAANVYSDEDILQVPTIDDEWVMVQGIVDCLFEDDDGLVLIDFKTDRVGEASVERAAQWYVNQIRTYCDAVSKLYGKPVAEAFLFFLTPSIAYEMDPNGGPP